MANSSSPIRPTDNEARTLARDLLDTARFGALGVITPDTGAPLVTRVAVGTDLAGWPVTLISELSQHTKALRTTPECSLLVGEPGSRGDPLAHPRLTLQAKAHFISRDAPQHPVLRKRYLVTHPKAKLYIDFADFSFVRFDVTAAFLNGGFGKAFILSPDDLKA